MRVLLHTPLKPPDSATPSGDREMARGLVRLLRRLGHTVVMPATSRVAPGVPAAAAHLALERRARSQAARLIARWRTLPIGHPERFDLWFTYHCYYRKPDWLGPMVTPGAGRALCDRRGLACAAPRPGRDAARPSRRRARAGGGRPGADRQSARRRRRQGTAAAGRPPAPAAALHRYRAVSRRRGAPLPPTTSRGRRCS